LIFRRPSEDRCLSFELVAQHCHVALNDVEPLLMKAMSRSLIRAVIDQVTSTVRVSWAQPRVLDHAQIVQLRDRMQNWAQHIDQTSIMLEGEAPELFL
jgi:26S proteasome regulatory subunit N9